VSEALAMMAASAERAAADMLFHLTSPKEVFQALPRFLHHNIQLVCHCGRMVMLM
jgi:hypothetical protein